MLPSLIFNLPQQTLFFYRCLIRLFVDRLTLINYLTPNIPVKLMRDILNRLYDHGTFSSAETRQILIDLASGIYNNSQMAAFLSAFCMRSITVAELRGFRDAMLELCIPLDLNAYGAIDLCGTGGDGKHTFNISTLASFILAGAGHKVANMVIMVFLL